MSMTCLCWPLHRKKAARKGPPAQPSAFCSVVERDAAIADAIKAWDSDNSETTCCHVWPSIPQRLQVSLFARSITHDFRTHTYMREFLVE